MVPLTVFGKDEIKYNAVSKLSESLSATGYRSLSGVHVWPPLGTISNAEVASADTCLTSLAAAFLP
jgi:hypothetical protein